MHRRRFLAGAGSGAVGAVGLSRFTGVLRAGEDIAADVSGAEGSGDQRQVPHAGSHRVLWSAETGEGVAALTFDDGPFPGFTPRVLDVLDRYGVKATFFMMGHNVSRHRRLGAEVVAAGHEVGNHTWSHVTLPQADEATTASEIQRGAAAVAELTGRPPSLFRPPRGQLSGWGLRHAALSGARATVLWSITRGVKGIGTPEAVADHLAALGPGDIVGLHDGLGRGHFNPEAAFTRELAARREVEVAVLPRVIEEARARGITFVTVPELLAVEAGEPRPESAAAS